MNLAELNALNARAVSKRASLEKRPLLQDVVSLSKEFPFFGYVEVEVTGTRPFLMFSNNDDFVARHYFWGGKDAYEATSLALWAKLAQSSPFVVDVGSYTGVYSLAAACANPKCKVLAFEALDRNYSRLLLNRAVNNLGNVQTIGKAVSDRDGALELNIYAGDAVLVSGSSLVGKESAIAVEKKVVPTVQLDNFLRDKPARVGQMKIDAEGAEHLVLAGAREVIKRDMPDLFIELLTSADLHSLATFFDGLGYTYFKINDRTGELCKVEALSAGGDMDTLNSFITRRTAEQVSTLGFTVIT